MDRRQKLLASFFTTAFLILAGLIAGLVFYDLKNSDLTARVSTTFDARSGSGERLNKSLSQELTLENISGTYAVSREILLAWNEPYLRDYTGKVEPRPTQEKIEAYLTELASKLDRPAVDAHLEFDQSGKVKKLAAGQVGLALNIQKSAANISRALYQGQSSADLVTDEIKPQISTDKSNELGLKVLLGQGESSFADSPVFRKHNINAASKIFSGIILKPGEEFSFNNSLGPVTASAGYFKELVVKNGKLVPEYGGGICQVSTTLFRAALSAGLPILERHAHSLPVRYYNPQGYDATIYPGVSDLRFQNDTPEHILIQSRIIGAKIYFNIYGTSDGRQVAIEGPRQYDIKQNGSLKAVLNRVITLRDGSQKIDVFLSNYRSPSAFPKIRNPLE